MSLCAQLSGYFANVTPKTTAFQATDAVVTMAVAGQNVWLALSNGAIELHDVHTGGVVHVFAPAARPSSSTRVWSLQPVIDPTAASGRRLLGTTDRDLQEKATPQMWVGLSTGTIEVYDARRCLLIRQLRKHMAGVYCFAEAAQAASVFSGSADCQIAQWRVADGQLLRMLSGHANYVRCLYAEGTALVSGSDDGTIRVWDVPSGAPLQVSRLHAASGGVSTLCRVGVTMWSGDNNGQLAVWRLQESGAALLISHPHEGRITSLRRVGSRVYSTGVDGYICVYHALDGTMVERMADHAGARVTALQSVVEVDRFYLWSGAADNTVRCWHHDEHMPSTSVRAHQLDMRWYYSTQRPYLASNERLLDEQRELAELVVLSNGTEENVRAYLDENNENQQSAAMRYYVMEANMRERHKDAAKLVEETRRLDSLLADRKAQLAVVQENLTKTLDAANAARAQLQASGYYVTQPPAPVPGVAGDSVAAAPPVPVPPPAGGVPPPPPPVPVPSGAVPLPPSAAPPPVSAVPAPVPAPATTPAPPPPPPPSAPASGGTGALQDLAARMAASPQLATFGTSGGSGPLDIETPPALTTLTVVRSAPPLTTTLTSTTHHVVPITSSAVQVARSTSYEPPLPPPPPPSAGGAKGAPGANAPKVYGVPPSSRTTDSLDAKVSGGAPPKPARRMSF